MRHGLGAGTLFIVRKGVIPLDEGTLGGYGEGRL